LLDTAIDVNQRHKESGFTPLHWAVGCQNLKAVKFLLENKADVNATDSYSPLSSLSLLPSASLLFSRDFLLYLVVGSSVSS
jgi:ankyrin repeat protein